MNSLVQFAMDSRIAIITLKRAEKGNAMNGQMVVELRHVLNELAVNDAVDIILLQGDGNHFCAGGDIQWMSEMASRPYDDNYQDALLLADLMFELYSYPKPTIALAHGATFGGGLGLLCTCDIVLASDNASFGFSEVKVGITPSTISPYVIAAIGERKARYYFLTAETFDAHTAKQIGLVEKIVPQSSLYEEGLALAKCLAENNLRAMVSAKKLVREVTHENITKEMTHQTASHLAKMRATPDAKEGLKAFIEKRKPRWINDGIF